MMILFLFLISLTSLAWSRTYMPLTDSWKSLMHSADLSRLRRPQQRRPSALPANFDARTAFPGCVHAVLDQGACGSCWAFASTEVLSDRLCIFGVANVTLSPQALLSCEEENLGCLMGSPPNFAWEYLQDHGVPSIECVPYVSGDGHVPKCTDGTCNNGSEARLWRAGNYTHVGNWVDPAGHEAAISEAIVRGPVDATFNVFADFENYGEPPGWVDGIYKWSGTWDYQGLHSVKVIGFGVNEKGVEYYEVQNSWGAAWGDNGYFKFQRGSDQCYFEEFMYTGDPAHPTGDV